MSELQRFADGWLGTISLIGVPFFVAYVFGYRAGQIHSNIIRWIWYIFGFGCLIWIPLLFLTALYLPSHQIGVPGMAALVGAISGARWARKGNGMFSPAKESSPTPRLKDAASSDDLWNKP